MYENFLYSELTGKKKYTVSDFVLQLIESLLNHPCLILKKNPDSSPLQQQGRFCAKEVDCVNSGVSINKAVLQQKCPKDFKLLWPKLIHSSCNKMRPKREEVRWN